MRWKWIWLGAGLVVILSGCAKKQAASIVTTEATTVSATTATEESISQTQDNRPESKAESTEEKSTPATPIKIGAEISSYGTNEKGESLLSFEIQPDSVIQYADGYEVRAKYYSGIDIPKNLEDGYEFIVTTDEETGASSHFVVANGKRIYAYVEGKKAIDDKTQEFDVQEVAGHRFLFTEGTRFEDKIKEGKLFIRKDAMIEDAMEGQKKTVNVENLAIGGYFNGVQFDQKGYATKLIYYGE